MIPVARMSDTTFCWAYCHGSKCCCHAGPGINIEGDKTVLAEMMPIVRMGDTTAHTCPHCRTGMALGMNKQVFSTMIGHHELGHGINENCGLGVQTSASKTVIG